MIMKNLKRNSSLLRNQISDYIYELQSFWFWDFSEDQLILKCTEVTNIMKDRKKSNKPRVTVIVPAHKEEKYILWTLKSLALQTFKDIEFIIVANWEEKDSKTETIARLSWFKVIFEKNPWISNARQVWLLEAGWEIIINTDADTLHEKDWISNILRLMESRKLQYWAWFSRMITKSKKSYCYHEIIGVTHIFKQALWNKFVTWFCEADSFFYRDIAIKAWWWNPNIRLAEWIDLFRRMEKLYKNKFLHVNEWIINFTSDRRYDWKSILKHSILSNYNWVMLSLWMKPNVNDCHYPNIR